MVVLAVETSGSICSVAVCDSEGIIAERAFRHRMQLSQRLVGDVESVLRDARMELSSLEGLVVGIGPGSFTGLRIGVTTIKTWAHYLQKPVIAISSLEALASEYREMIGAVILPMIRNRPESVHLQRFLIADSGPIAQGSAEVVAVTDIQTRLPDTAAPLVICGDGAAYHLGLLKSQLPESVLFGPGDAPRASAVAEVGRRRLEESISTDPLQLVPFYVAPPPIGPPARAQKT